MPVSVPPALESLLDVLQCPTCRGCLHPDRGSLRCLKCHTYDISRHGVVSLLTGNRATSGDDAAMARARQRFLATGTYGPIRCMVDHLAVGTVTSRNTVVDVGCGTGYYLASVLTQSPGARGLGLDSSARALREMARAHGRAAAATWDVFRPLPLADGVADVVLNVFAPRNPSEFHRVLHPEGRLVVVRPTNRHRREVRDRVPGMVAIDPLKEARLHETLAPYFTDAATELIEYASPLSKIAALDLVGMTPSARHLNDAALDELDLDFERATISVLATAYSPR